MTIYGPYMDIYDHFMKMGIIENLPYMGMESSDPIYGPYELTAPGSLANLAHWQSMTADKTL